MDFEDLVALGIGVGVAGLVIFLLVLFWLFSVFVTFVFIALLLFLLDVVGLLAFSWVNAGIGTLAYILLKGLFSVTVNKVSSDE